MPVNQFTPGINLPSGFQVANPFPVDSYLGPYPGETTTAARNSANNTITPANRYQGMQVILLAPDGGATVAYKYWYRGGTADENLVEFSAGGAEFDSSTSYTWTAPQYFSAGFSAAGGVTFTNSVMFAAGLSANGGSTFGSIYFGGAAGTQINATTISSNSLTVENGISASGGITFNSLVRFPQGLSAAGATLGTLVVNSGISANGGITFNSTANFTAGLSAAGATLGTLVVNNGISAAGGITFNGNLSGATATFSRLATFTSGISAAGGITFNSLSHFTTGLSGSGATLGTLVVNNGISAAGGVTFANNVHVGGTLSVNGNFYVAGTLTTVNESQLLIQDKYLVLGSTFATGSQADGAGIYLGSTTSAIAGICYSNGSSEWSSSHSFDIPAASFYRVGGNNVLASTYLGSVVTGSSLASVGTLTNGVWNASVIGLAYGGTNKNLSGTGVSGGIVFKDGTGLSVLSDAGTSGNILRSNGENAAPSWTSPSTLTGLTADQIIISTTVNNFTFKVPFVSGVVGTGSRTLFVESTASPSMSYNPSTDIFTVTQIEAIVDGGTW